MNTYLALTIGPIYKTLSQAQRTREFWGYSYMFSWMMRETINTLLSQKVIDKNDILMPYRSSYSNPKAGTGLYHDRMIARIAETKKDKILTEFRETADNILTRIANEYVIEIKTLQSYFRFNAVVFDLDTGQNIIETATNYLDTLELQNPIYHNAWKIDLPDLVDDLNGKIFYKDAFERGGDFHFFFDSIPEIATRGLIEPRTIKQYELHVDEDIKQKLVKEKNDRQAKLKSRLANKEVEKLQDMFIDNLSKDPVFKETFRNYHKYFAVVHADGDNFGATISKIGHDEKSVRKLSATLFNFTTDAVNRIKDYGGTNVYAGGDDLLFFAPVAVGNQKQTIFHLIDNLDKLFKERVSGNPDLASILVDPKPTLSWGVSISYYKYPLSEAIESSRKLLFDDAKNHPGKNAIAFRLNKHSGQFFGATLGKSSCDYHIHFKAMLDTVFETDQVFLSSLQYRLVDNKALLNEIFKIEEKGHRKERLSFFFDNFFNEKIHSDKKKFVNAVRDMLFETFNSGITDTTSDKSEDAGTKECHADKVLTAIYKTYSTLRLVHFLNSKSDE